MSRQGVFPLASSLDHVGPIARAVDDLRLLFAGSREFYPGEKERSPRLSDNPPRLGRLRGFFDLRANPVVRSALDNALQLIRSTGAEIVDLNDPVNFEEILVDHRRVMAAEAASVHSQWLEENPDDYPPRIRDLILEGRQLTALDYLNASEQMKQARQSITEAIDRENLQAIIVPATIGTAPDVSTTGDPAFNSPWSFTGLPTVSFPTGLAPDGLPVAAQLVGHHQSDCELLGVAAWCEQAIRTPRH
jgi:aspartyl-tRNA(Asn)/glutamyl-tRNA(Gln) amidotransferase subunit A